MLIAFLSALVTLMSFLSYTMRFEGRHVFSKKTIDSCIKTQRIYNCILSFVIIVVFIVDLCVDQELEKLAFVFLCIQMVCDSFFGVAYLCIARSKRRKMVLATLANYLKDPEDAEKTDEILVKDFCKQYRDVSKKEALVALKRYRRAK